MKQKILKIILKSLVVLVIVAGIAVGAFFILRACGFTSKDDFLRLRDNLGDSIWFWLVVALLQIMQVIFIPISNQIITVPLALCFPVNELWKVFLCSWLSIWAATIVLYFIGRFGGGKLLNWLLGDKEQTEKCTKFLNRGWMFFPIGMLLPLPDDILTIIAGTAKMNVWFIIVCSFCTRAIDVACSVFGLGLLTRYWWGWVLLAIGVLALGVVTLLLVLREKKRASH